MENSSSPKLSMPPLGWKPDLKLPAGLLRIFTVSNGSAAFGF